MSDDIYKASLKYHQMGGRPGKIEVVPTKPCVTQRDLSLAYSPGVAEPCRVIAQDPDESYNYTIRGNLVAVISNGTAVLGLGDIGPYAAKPVMEGKGVLFKRFADIDVFDIEINEKDPDKFIACVERLGPTFGGINLEDIASPHCFFIETELQRRMDIPVFHDDQHGTAIIAGAAFLNACELTGRKLSEVKCVFNGAGAAGQSVAKLFVKLGVRKENIVMCDKKGPILAKHMNTMDIRKQEWASAVSEAATLAEALKGADAFVGCSVGNVLNAAMIKSMADRPIVFAMANPTPEIDYLVAKAARDDVIMATGRSDYPNQVNNVLGFPFIFRGALDTRARAINDEMKMAAVRSLAALAKEPVPELVSRAYGGEHFEYGLNYLIPKPFDPRVLIWESAAVAEAAMKTGVARHTIDIEEYRERLRQKVDSGRSLISVPFSAARDSHVRIAMPGAEFPKILEAARQTIGERLAIPVLIGKRADIDDAMVGHARAEYDIIDPAEHTNDDRLIAAIKRRRPLDRLTDEQCRKELADPFVYATLLVEDGLCDGLLTASDRPYAEMVRPILKYASTREGVSRVAGMHMLAFKDRQLFFADTTLINDPSAEELAEVAQRTARVVERMHITPRLAFVSFINGSDSSHPDIQKMVRALKLVRRHMPTLAVYEDPVQADVALDPERFKNALEIPLPEFPANILIFPNLIAANAGFRIARVLGGGQAVGPVLLGLQRPCNVMPRGSTEEEIVNMMAITASIARRRRGEMTGEYM